MFSEPRSTLSSDESGPASTLISSPLSRNRICGIECTTLLQLVAKFPDDVGPFHNIPEQEFVELLRAHRHRNCTLFGPELDDVRPLHCGIHGGIELVDDGLRRPGGGHQS